MSPESEKHSQAMPLPARQRNLEKALTDRILPQFLFPLTLLPSRCHTNQQWNTVWEGLSQDPSSECR